MWRKIRKFNWRKWADEWVLAGQGILLATREKRFWIGFLIAFFGFGTLMNLLSGGLAKFELMGALGFPQGLQIIWSALIGTIGINMIFSEWLAMFLIAVLQGVLIGLIALVWKKKRANTAEVEKAGIVAGLIALGAGCPTCGTTLLTPLLGALFSTGGLAVTGVISGVVTAAAVIIALFAIKRIGEEAYVIIINEEWRKKHEK